jgi:hypothetical protein
VAEPVLARPAPVVGLERPLHRWPPRPGCPSEGPAPDGVEPWGTVTPSARDRERARRIHARAARGSAANRGGPGRTRRRPTPTSSRGGHNLDHATWCCDPVSLAVENHGQPLLGCGPRPGGGASSGRVRAMRRPRRAVRCCPQLWTRLWMSESDSP